ncbi:hypothetical protein HY993_03490 [Candidatus Micrarchaeota archaeon]|nr:hypothetical protein [Candidatus Micrarchaeota archaeon]
MKQTLAIVFGLAVILAFFVGYEGTLKNGVSAGAGAQELNKEIRVGLPGLDDQGKGAIAFVKVRLAKGSGKVFIEFSQGEPLVGDQTQSSIQTAFKVATKVAKELGAADADGVDAFYTFETDSDSVSGKSAGAAMALATIALLTGREQKENVLITGTIQDDESIGAVSGVLEKAKAGRQFNYTTILVPVGTSSAVKQEQVCEREQQEFTTITRCQTRSVPVDIASEAGITVIEVANVRQAIEYALK